MNLHDTLHVEIVGRQMVFAKKIKHHKELAAEFADIVVLRQALDVQLYGASEDRIGVTDSVIDISTSGN